MAANILQNALKMSMIVSLFGSIFILISGLLLYCCLPAIVEIYVDRLAKDLNTTRLIINAQESIVPTKDDMPEEIDLGNWPRYTAVVVSGLGISLVLFSLFGIAASKSRRPDYLLILVVLLMTGVICQFLLLRCFVDLNCYINCGAKEKLVETLHNNYEVGARSNSTFTFLMNTVMLMGQCCGIRGPADFLQMGILNFTYDLEDKTYHVPVLFPLACCRRRYIDKGFQSAVVCAKSWEISYINNRGCYDKMHDYIGDNYGKIVAVVFILIILWEVLQILTGLLILFSPSKVEMDAVDEVLKAVCMEGFHLCNPKHQEQISIKQRKLVFVPGAKEASFDSKPGVTSQIW